MRPYLAVIRDSFRAALSSRVLWVAFVAIWLILGFLAPVGYREDFTTTFRGQDFHNGTRMKAMLARGLVDPQASQTAIGRIAAAMPEDLRRQLRRVGEGDEVRIRLSVLSDALNELLDDESWYDAEAWKKTPRLKELRDLDQLADQELTESARRRRARLRMEAAMPGVFETRSSRAITLTYAGMDFPANFAVDKTQFVTLVNQWVLPTIINWLLGFILIFLGILVTASIVPDMLQPGSLHLLLSKPVSRTLLLLSKFIGGCAFVLLCVTQLVLGLYLIAGLRLDVWNIRLLWCIPVSVFLFSVFYSVSTLAGLRWRSSILAIGVTTIFGAICLVVGLIGGLFDGLVTRPEQIQNLAIAGDTLFGSTRGGGLKHFDHDQNQWVEVFESDAMSADRVIPPIALDDQTIASARARGGRFNPFGSGALDLLVLSRADGWKPEPSLRLPTATTWLYHAGPDGVLAMNTSDLAITTRASILEAAGQESRGEDPSDEDEESSNAAKQQGWLAKLTSMMGGVTSGFESVLPERIALTPPRGVVVADQGDWLAALSRGRLIRLEKQSSEGSWRLAAERQLEGEPSRRSVIARSNGVVLVARAEEPIQMFDAATFEPVGQVDLPSSLVPVAATGLDLAAAPQDQRPRFALLTSDGRCRLVQRDPAPASVYVISNPIGPSESEAVHFHRDKGLLYIVHHIDQIDVLGGIDLSLQKRIRPSLSRWRLVDRYVIGPLRTLVPQTGELGETIAAMVSGKTAVAVNNGSDEEELVRYDIIRPVVSCALFLTVMLTIGCVYFARCDF